MINTFEKISRLITYSSSGRESRIHLLMCNRDHLKEVRNCKVINGESVAAQHSYRGCDLGAEIDNRIKAGWKNRRKVFGVLCGRRIGDKLIGKVHRTVVRPAMMYGAETWAMKETEEKKMDVAEMRMLRWICGMTRGDKIWNEVIRGTPGVRKLSDKI
ncbi:uncharacterized protein [Palaemon carinicauda]|uniref:uncharacterized protein n=1 Tax=Palaemon carinicauda TaxID=392227 RepID=UPI0035B5B602